MIIDSLDGSPNLVRKENIAFAMPEIILQTFVGPIASATLIAKLPGL